MSPDDPVVITGCGVRSAAGTGLASLTRALRDHRPCVSPEPSALPVAWQAAAPDPVSPHPDLPDDRKSWLGLAAAQEAVVDAGLDGQWPAADRRALFVGTGLSSVTPGELAEDVYRHLRDGVLDEDAVAADIDPTRAAPRRHLPAAMTGVLASLLGVRGPTGTSFSACAAAAQAIAEGARAVGRGEVDVAVVGGHDSMLHPLGMLSFVVLGALSGDTCRPFDPDRDGFLIGEGAASFVLERRSRARARGARVLAQVVGAGTSADGWNVTAPHPAGAGAERAMRRALRDAGVAASAVDAINAHGTGTPVGDVAEAQAIARVFGDRVPVSSTKGALGHTIAAAGAIEAAICVSALQDGLLPGTVGHLRADPECPIAVATEPRDRALGLVLSNSFGFGGQNASLLLAAPDWTRPDA